MRWMIKFDCRITNKKMSNVERLVKYTYVSFDVGHFFSTLDIFYLPQLLFREPLISHVTFKLPSFGGVGGGFLLREGGGRNWGERFKGVQ